MAAKWRPRVIAVGGVTDPYQPVERRLKLTRQCIEVLAEFGNPASIVTKNHLVTRDIDILSGMARQNLCSVFISITTLNAELTGIMEPRTSAPARRLAAIQELTLGGIPVGVLVAPVIPGLTDHELPDIIASAVKAGACSAHYQLVRLPHGVAELFTTWLEQHMPERKDKVLNRIRATRRGRLNDGAFGSRMRGDGIFIEQIDQMFQIACRRAGLGGRCVGLDTSRFRRPDGQMSLF